MKYFLPKKIYSDISSFNTFIELYDKTKDLFIDKLIIDFSNITWFNANMLAVLGSLINVLQDNLVTVKLQNIPPAQLKLFERNHFMSNFGGGKLPDRIGTTVKYKKFSASEEKGFLTYLENELFANTAMPVMSEKLKQKIQESILEVFNNAVFHGKCKSVYTCGQYYSPKKMLDFTIVDIGRTISGTVNEFLNVNKTGEEAIKWALIPGNTTKTGPIPGGNGLKIITDFLTVNEGNLQIISHDGYFEQKAGSNSSSSFQLPFPGTIVNFEFKTDTSYYCFKSEISIDDIFN
jgi:hypothetical protein